MIVRQPAIATTNGVMDAALRLCRHAHPLSLVPEGALRRSRPHRAALRDEKEHPSTKIKRATRPPIGRTSQVRGEGRIPREVDRSSPSDHEAARGSRVLARHVGRARRRHVSCEVARPGTWCATSCGCRTALVTTARSRPALRLAVASGVDLAAAIDAFLSQPDLAATTRAKYRQTLTVVEGRAWRRAGDRRIAESVLDDGERLAVLRAGRRREVGL